MITSTIDGTPQSKRTLVDPVNPDYGWVYTEPTVNFTSASGGSTVQMPTLYFPIRIECEHWAPAGSTTCRFGCTNA